MTKQEKAIKVDVLAFLRAIAEDDLINTITSLGSYEARQSLPSGGQVKFEYVSAENRKRPRST